jgi:hypothetical protein
MRWGLNCQEKPGEAWRKEVTPSISQPWVIDPLKNLGSSFGLLKFRRFRTFRLRMADLHRFRLPQISITPSFNIEDV